MNLYNRCDCAASEGLGPLLTLPLLTPPLSLCYDKVHVHRDH
ncbi:MAG TPA: hypothetical protein VJK28_00435 [Nitrospiria bacterium]|nr:hypothetical protein [Nitrospiria bacterium]